MPGFVIDERKLSMKKKIVSAIFVAVLACSFCACSSSPSSSSMQEPPASQASEIPSSSAHDGLQEQTALSLLTPIMEGLGEDGNVAITSIKENSPDEDLKRYEVEFVAGEKGLVANLFETDGGFEVHSIALADDSAHFYYFPSLATSSSISGMSFQLYDYATDEPLPAPDVEISSDEVAEIISQIPEISVSPDTVGGPMLYLDVNVESAPTEDIATSFYGSSLQFLVEYIQLDPIPYSTVTFNIMLDGTIRLGYMQMVAFPELGILGTEPPVMEIEEETTVGIFEEKYDEYMYAIDADNIQSGMYS